MASEAVVYTLIIKNIEAINRDTFMKKMMKGVAVCSLLFIILSFTGACNQNTTSTLVQGYALVTSVNSITKLIINTDGSLVEDLQSIAVVVRH